MAGGVIAEAASSPQGSPHFDKTRSPKAQTKLLSNWQNIVAGIVAFMIFAGGLTLWQQMVSVSPARQALYKLVGIDLNPLGLEFASVRTRARPESDGAVLVVEGSIKNVTGTMVTIPAVHVAMRAADGRVTSSWDYQPKQRQLEAGGTLTFVTETKNPPQNTHDIKLNFTGRSPAGGGLN
jgi:hypothetical protein